MLTGQKLRAERAAALTASPPQPSHTPQGSHSPSTHDGEFVTVVDLPRAHAQGVK